MPPAKGATLVEYHELVGADSLAEAELLQIAARLIARYGPAATAAARHTSEELTDVGLIGSSRAWQRIAAFCHDEKFLVSPSCAP